MGREASHNPYHGVVIRGGLTRNIGRRFPEVVDEIGTAFDDVLALKGGGMSAIFHCASQLTDGLQNGNPSLLCRP